VVEREEHVEVPEQLMRWVKVNGRPMRGLVRRRRAEPSPFRQLIHWKQWVMWYAYVGRAYYYICS